MKRITKKEVFGEIISYIKTIGIAVLVTYIVCNKIVCQAQVPTGSMESTVDAGSRVIINRTAYWFEEPERGDIVAFEPPDDDTKIYLKRIIGLPGETIEGRNGRVYINGTALEEGYIKEICYMDFGPYTIPEGSYFMMGDNRNDSYDSRYWVNKYVSKDAIWGKVSIELYPHLKILE